MISSYTNTANKVQPWERQLWIKPFQILYVSIDWHVQSLPERTRWQWANQCNRTDQKYLPKETQRRNTKAKNPWFIFGRTFKAKLLFSKVCSSVAVPKSKVVFYMEHAKLIASYFSLFWQWTNQNGRLNVYHNCAPIRTLGRWLVI